MVLTRGIKSTFSEGEVVLCIEPDHKKASRIYEAKILGISTHIDSSGRKRNKYNVHFQGWNVHWDRHVDEVLLLNDTPENRELMETLEEERSQRKKHLRKLKRKELSKRIGGDRDISLIFTPAMNESGNSDVVSTPNGSESISSLSDVGSELAPRPRDCGVKRRKLDFDAIASNPKTFTQNVTNRKVLKKLRQVKESLLDSSVKLEIDRSDEMLLLLYDDYEMVVNEKKLCKLPAKMSVLTLLENYVKRDMERFICDEVTSRRTFMEMKIAVNDRLTLLTNFTSPLLNLFNQVLPDILYSDCEAEQLEKITQKQLNSTKIIKHHKSSSPRLCIQQVQKSISERLIEVKEEEDGSDGVTDTTIRVTRSRYGISPTPSKGKTSRTKSLLQDDSSSGDERQISRSSLRSSHIKKEEASDGANNEEGEGESGVRERRLSQRLTPTSPGGRRYNGTPAMATTPSHQPPPPPTPLTTLTNPQINRVKKEAPGSMPTRRSCSKLQQEQYIQPLLCRVNEWNLCPTDHMRKSEPLPLFYLYGASHLLRLIDRLSLSLHFECGGEGRMQMLQNFLTDLIKFICDREEELISKDQYTTPTDDVSK